MFHDTLHRVLLSLVITGGSLHATNTFVIVGQPYTVGTGDCDPFGCPSLFGLGTYQQVYISSAFTGPLTISQLTFFDMEVHNNGIQALGTYTLSLAYTSKPPAGLDLNNPANNITSGSQTFFTGALPRPIVDNTGRQQLVVYGTPFAYNPASGNLILTITVAAPFDQFPLLYLDYANSTAATSNAYFGTLNGGPVSGGNDIGGLVTEFSNQTLQITGPGTLAASVIGTAYGPVTFTSTGGTGTLTWGASGLPAGLTFSKRGVLRGTPTGAQGTYTLQFTVGDSSNSHARLALTLIVNSVSIQITGPTSLPAAAQGVTYGPVTFTATGGTGTYTWSAVALPSGLTMSSSGMLSGAPATGTQGSYNPQFKVIDSSNNIATITLPLTVN